MAYSFSSFKFSDKGKCRAKLDSHRSLAHENPNPDNHNLGSGSNPGSNTCSTTPEGLNQSSEVARLKEQLAEQGKACHDPVSNALKANENYLDFLFLPLPRHHPFFLLYAKLSSSYSKSINRI